MSKKNKRKKFKKTISLLNSCNNGFNIPITIGAANIGNNRQYAATFDSKRFYKGKK